MTRKQKGLSRRRMKANHRVPEKAGHRQEVGGHGTEAKGRRKGNNRQARRDKGFHVWEMSLYKRTKG